MKRSLWGVATALAALMLVVPVALAAAFLVLFVPAHRVADGWAAASVCSPVRTPDGKFAHPLPQGGGHISSGFGPRPNPFGPGVIPAGFASEDLLVNHWGTDLAAVPEGTVWVSGTSGTVTGVDVGGEAGGNVMLVQHDADTEIMYAHSATGTSRVEVGDTVIAGTPMAGTGSSGASSGVHLHVEVTVNGTPVDPEQWFADRGITLRAPSSSTSVAGSTFPPRPAPTARASTPVEQTDLNEPVELPGPRGPVTFQPYQVRHLATIVAVGQELKVPDRAITIALMTAMVESFGGKNLANPAHPQSMDMPHDGTGQDHDSLGIFQQRPQAGWGTVQELMDPTYAARAFFGGPHGPNQGNPPGLLDVPGWEEVPLGQAAQSTQASAVPDAYEPWKDTALALQRHLGAPADADTCPTTTAPDKDTGDHDDAPQPPTLAQPSPAVAGRAGRRTGPVAADDTQHPLPALHAGRPDQPRRCRTGTRDRTDRRRPLGYRPHCYGGERLGAPQRWRADQ